MEKLRLAIAAGATDVYEEALDTLGGVESVPELYGLIGLLGEVVEDRHACMRCDEGCSDCCGQLPLVTFAEWRLLHGWMLANLTAEERREAVGRCEKFLEDESTVLPRWLRLGGMDLESSAAMEYIDDIFGNEATPCPLLVDGRCSVYAARPLVCRAYGRMMRTEEDTLYCQRIADKLVPYEKEKGEFFLPVYRPYQDRSYALDGEGSYFTLIAIWILSHRDADGDLVNEPFDIADVPEWPVLETRWGFAEAFAEE